MATKRPAKPAAPAAVEVAGAKVTRRKLSDYALDPVNANVGTSKGASVLGNSVEKFGAARSGVVDKDGVMRAGNHTAEQLMNAGIEDVIEVETTGQTWVVVKRKDMDGKTGREYAVFDNRAGELIAWDTHILADLAQQGDIVLAELWNDNEFNAMLREQSKYDALDGTEATGEFPDRRRDSANFPVAIVLTKAEFNRWTALKDKLGLKEDRAAFLRMMERLDASGK